MEIIKNDEKAIVRQSNVLIEKSYRLQLGQQKFLRLLASKVKKNDEDLKEYEFRITDLMDLFEMKSKANYSEIPKKLKELMQNVLTFEIDGDETNVPFLVIAQHKKGSGIVRVQFHPFLKPMYLHLGKDNPYTEYKLSNALKLKSIYALRFYELLKQYQKIGNRIMDIEEIRELFKIEPTEYERYNDFKRFVIKKALSEINTKTDIRVVDKEIKGARKKVVSINFIITGIENEKEKSNIDEKLKSSSELIDKTRALFKDITSDLTKDTADKVLVNLNGDFEKLQKIYVYMKNYKKPIPNPIGLLIDLSKNFQEIQEYINKGNFNNYDQRKYDFDAIERKLLGWDDDDKDNDLKNKEIEETQF